MTNKWKIATVAVLMTAGISAPAFAQSAHRTGSPLPHYYTGDGAVIFGAWGPPATQPSGLNAFAKVPGRGVWTTRSAGRQR
jgi:hypothetical protein